MQQLIGFIKQLMPPLHKQAIATLVNFRYTVQGVPVATAVNVAGAGTISNVVKLTVAVAV
jgi:hypothetical protein